MCLVMCKRRLKHCYVKCVEKDSRKKGNLKTNAKKKHNDILVPSQRYQDSRHLLQNPTFPSYVTGFSNRTQRFTGSNYLYIYSSTSSYVKTNCAALNQSPGRWLYSPIGPFLVLQIINLIVC